uniref:Testis expressed 2 n=1 Tax=Leptobrachium leishanense TaxID=445787 RepID=A0A8C5R3Q8_9ANUR
MTSLDSSHAEKTHSGASKQSAPKVQVQRSVSRETITIRFSAFGKEEEEEEDVFQEPLDEQSIVTAVEAKEDLYFEPGTHLNSSTGTSPNVAVIEVSPLMPCTVKPTLNTGDAIEPSPSCSAFSAVPLTSSSSPQTCPEANTANVCPPEEHRTSIFSSPSKANTMTSTASAPSISSAKPFLSLVKSLSTEVEPKETTSPARHRHLMKSLVKSLSTDTSKQDPESSKPPDSKLNLHLFKQFTQPRVTGGDSKTAPSSPITSPSDGRSFFKVTEVEARIEDTKRRFSEVIYEPFQLLSKIMGDDSSSYRPKALSSSASELSNLSSLNGHLESNNNYSIKEEEGDSEADNSVGAATLGKDEKPKTPGEHMKDSDSKGTLLAKDVGVRTSALELEKCSLSALVSREDEEFTELYSEDFDFDEGNEADHLLDESEAQDKTELLSEDEVDRPTEGSDIPLKTLYFLVFVVYGYLLLPLPHYIDGLCMGIGLGFMAAIGIIWLFASPRSRQYKLYTGLEPLSVEPLQIEEPEIMKGWMNEIQNYDPETYHATLTQSVFVRLEGSTLRLSKPNKNISRRTIYNEAKPDVVYISQRIYDLLDSKVYLLPKSLARKRVWNKKYPVCVELARQDDFMAKVQADREASEDKPPADQSMDESKKPVDGSKPVGHKDQVLYLFGRTGREKEEWFRKLLLASKIRSDLKKPSVASSVKPGLLLSHSRQGSQSGILSHSRSSSKGSMDEMMAQTKPKELPGNLRQKMLLDYNVYMAKCVPQEEKSPTESPIHSANSSPTATKKIIGAHSAEGNEQQAWVNALLGRIFWDFLGEKHWSDLVSKKIQMKLSKIKLPYFMNELTLTELDMGVAVPKILQAFKPTIDHRGVWTDLEISYNGSFLMTLETKMNLTRLGKEPLGDALKVGEIGKEGARPRAYYLADSDEESSSAGSSDEDDAPEAAGDKQQAAGTEGYVGAHRTSKIMRFVDKITKSKYFQKATETEFIKKKIEEVSNTPLLLTVEVQECRGTLTINIPPPPTDRIWYGFRVPPHLELKARPKLGEREVTLAHVTEWIEKKLEQEFKKIFVMPNMDDLYVSLMHSAMDPRSAKDAEPEATETS